MRAIKGAPDLSIIQTIAQKVLVMGREIAERWGRRPVLMEVCGTHTMSISRSGLRGLLRDVLDLRSGPGCPVCVTNKTDINIIVSIARLPGVIVTTFGDMLRVPGNNTTLEKERAAGAGVKIIYSPMEALALAEQNPDKQIVFPAVGFETTAPAVAVTIQEAAVRGVTNFSVLSLHKLIPAVLKTLLENRDFLIDGLLLPGHVCVITGWREFTFVADKYNVPSAVAGFEPIEILCGIAAIFKQFKKGQPEVVNTYRQLVTENGNALAKEIMAKCFEPTAVCWRGLGEIEASGLKLTREYRDFDANHRFSVKLERAIEQERCLCGQMLTGSILPPQCPLFGRACTPIHPEGPCMVSSEGVCAAYYNYGER